MAARAIAEQDADQDGVVDAKHIAATAARQAAQRNGGAAD